mgnify:CR=1 FL=1
MSWSPDGVSLAVTAGAATFASPAHIEIVHVGTGERRAVTTPPPGHIGDTSPRFSPDGRQIAFVRSISGGLGDVFVAPADGGRTGPRHLGQCGCPRRGLGAGRPPSRVFLGSQRRDQLVACAGRRRRAGAPRRRRRESQASEHRQARRIDCVRGLALRDQPGRGRGGRRGASGAGQPDQRPLELPSADFAR